MKIAFTIDHMTIGGAQKVCYNLLLWLKEQPDTEVFLIIYRDLVVGNVQYCLEDIPHIVISGGKSNRIRKIRKIIKDQKADLLVSFGTPNAMFDIPASLGSGVRTIVCERNDPAHFAGSKLTKIISRTLMRFADAFVFQTKDAQSFYGRAFANRSIVIPNPLLLPAELPQERYCGNDTKRIVSVGRLNKQKNFPFLIDAFKRINKDYSLVIIGEGPERENLKKLIIDNGLVDRVSLPGTSNQVINDIYDASVFVLSSDFEGMPNALIEAMAVGVPCISTDCPCGGPRDLITNGENGLLVPVGDTESLVNSINLLINNRELANKLGTNSLGIRNSLSLDNVANKWLRFFKLVKNGQKEIN